MLRNDTAPAGRPGIDLALADAVDARLDILVPAAPGSSDRLCEAMRYAVLGPGKRLRAVLTVLAGRELGAPEEPVLSAGCALEMLHAASLVFDDMPAMDDAALRRGRPATHIVYGEAVATLAAIGLISCAFSVVTRLPNVCSRARADMAAFLAGSIGTEGLCGGQLGDLLAGPVVERVETLVQIGGRKTGALFVAAVELGASAAGSPDERLDRLRGYAKHLGLAFQVCDDLADEGEDAGRPTYVGLLGRDRAEVLLRQQVELARGRLDRGDGPLGQLLDTLFARHLERVSA